MTKEETKNIHVGCKVYIWGNKEKPQKVIWRGLGTLGTGSPREIRFETGMFFSLDDPSQIEFAPNDVETEKPDQSFITIQIQNGYSKTEFFNIQVPSNNNFHERDFFMYKNGIEMTESGYYTTYNIELINKYRKNNDVIRSNTSTGRS